MNRPIRRVAAAIGVLMLLLLLNLNFVQVVRSDSYRSDPDNARVLLDEYSRQRGAITAQGVQVAESVKTTDRYKYLRKYPFGAQMAPLSGYYSLFYNKTELEAAEDKVLSGSDNRLFTTRFADLITGRDPRGGNVELTINLAAQAAAYTAMAGRRGAVVAIDPSTGAILAAVSTPSFDPALLSSHDPDAIEKAYKSLSADPNNPLLNRALNQTYPPGSVFKIVVAAAALQNGRTPTTVLSAPDKITLPGTTTTLQNYEGESCGADGKSTLDHALTISCNTAFAQLALDMGTSTIRKQAESFGINDQSLSTPLNVSPSTLGAIVDQAALGQSAIGQRDVRITPLQAAMLSAAVANDGKLMKPYLVKEETAPNLSVLSKATPDVLSIPIDAGNDELLKKMMLNVVATGTGTGAQIAGIEVAGKTGTADTGIAGQAPHAWFSGFAPVSNPKIAVAVIIENGGVTGSETTGGKAAAPVAAAVMKAYLTAIGSK
ncbi:MAG: pbpA [Pseudonocardiales bacterium]|nr:pbpA [Pseudonocardiales bacterium]